MIDYLFSVDLRFRHPFGSPTDITDALQILPDRSWTVGEARRTPKGAPLKGAYKESYWFARLFDGASVNYGLIRAIDDTLGSGPIKGIHKAMVV